MNRWNNGTGNQWFNEPMNLWITESMNQCETMDQWIHEPMNQQIIESQMNDWMQGRMSGVEWSGVEWRGGEGRGGEGSGAGWGGVHGVEWSGAERSEWMSERASERGEWVSEWAEEGGREGVSYFFVELPLHCFEMLPRYLLCGFCNTILFAHPAHCILQPPPANPHSETPHYAEKLHYAQLQRV